MTVADIARKLGGRKLSSGWIALCPAHNDHNPSLSLTETQDGQLLAKCHAGCEQSVVFAALKARGLLPEHPGRDRRATVAKYDYTDEGGRILYQVVRTEPKGFYQRRPDGRGGWVNKKGARQVLYRLCEVLESPIVFVTEGEKDVEALRDYGFVATTNSGGAEAPWLPSYTQALAGREVILIPDADAPGRQRVLRIARALLEHASRIIVFEPDGAKDISDWFGRGHSEVELIALIDDKLVTQW